MGNRARDTADRAELVALAYESALTARPFAALLPELARAIGADAGMLVLYAPELGAGELPVTHEMPVDLPRIYRAHFWSVDLWRIEMHRRKLPTGKAFGGSMFVPFAALLKSEMYNDALRQYGFIDTCAAELYRRGSAGAAISMLRARPKPFFGEAEVRTLDALMPHMSRAFDLHRRFSALIAERATLATVVDRIAGGALVCDRHGVVVHATPRAKRFLDSGHPLYMGDGRLRARLAHIDAQLTAIIAGTRGRRLPALIDLPDRDGAPSLRLTILPTAEAASLLAIRGTRVLVLIEDRVPKAATDVEVVAAAYGLTPAEARLLREVVDGASLRDVAERRRISLHTARNQMKQILHKTDCRRQVDLVRLCLATLRRSAPAP